MKNFQFHLISSPGIDFNSLLKSNHMYYRLLLTSLVGKFNPQVFNLKIG